MWGRADDPHHMLQPHGHAFHWRGAAGQKLHDEEDGSREQRELAHGGRDRAEQDAECGNREGVERAPARKRVSEPAIGTLSNAWTTRESDKPAAIRMTRPLAMIFESMISVGTTGMTSRCSTVPCSRSRMRAAPVRITASMVMLLTTCMTEENQFAYRFGLNLARITTLTGALTAHSGRQCSSGRVQLRAIN